VGLWARREEVADALTSTRRNEIYLPGAYLDPEIQISADIEALAQDAEIWLFAVPSQSMREVAKKIRHLEGGNRTLISVAKGIENGTLLTPTHILSEVLTHVDSDRITVVSGPSHAEEVALGLPTTVVAAARQESVAHLVQAVMMTEQLRVYTNTDVVGVEVSAAVKNVMAIAAGISDGVGFGDNAKAAIMTRGIAEITRLGVALGARQDTFGGLSGIGDLVVTCVSRHSRNRYVGEQIGKGRSLSEVEGEMRMVAEGVRTTLSAIALSRRHKVDMPITSAVYEILFQGKQPQDAVRELMTRRAKTEHWLPGYDPEMQFNGN
jgi:glycerol-3-phosphate dehydrogenase (NAD(P)+)